MLGTPKEKICAYGDCENIVRQFRTTDKFCSPQHAKLGGSNRATKAKTYFKAKANREPVSRTRAKTKAKERDSYICRLAGYEAHTCDARREAHHIIYLSEWEIDEQWNLICLCGFAHHDIVHKRKRYWQHRLLKMVGGEKWRDAIDESSLPAAAIQKLNFMETLLSKDSDETGVGVL